MKAPETLKGAQTESNLFQSNTLPRREVIFEYHVSLQRTKSRNNS